MYQFRLAQDVVHFLFQNSPNTILNFSGGYLGYLKDDQGRKFLALTKSIAKPEDLHADIYYVCVNTMSLQN